MGKQTKVIYSILTLLVVSLFMISCEKETETVVVTETVIETDTVFNVVRDTLIQIDTLTIIDTLRVVDYYSD